MKNMLLICLLVAGCAVVQSQSPTSHIPQQWTPLQVKVCEKPDSSFFSTVLPCSFDDPTTAGSLGIVVAVGGCNYRDCNSFSDTQSNSWNLGIAVPGYGGVPLWYTTLKAGSDTIYFAQGRDVSVIIAEYPCPSGACSLDDAAFADYRDAGLTPAGVEIQDNKGWAGVERDRTIANEPLSPVETHESCELLISWALHGSPPVKAGPNFTLRADANNFFAIEDSATTIPGYYLASMSWRYPNSWVQGVAAFKMGGCN